VESSCRARGRSRAAGWTASWGSTASGQRSRCCRPRMATDESSWRSSTRRQMRATTGTRRPTPLASATSHSPSKTSTPSLPACEPAALNSSERSSATRTSTGSATSAAGGNHHRTGGADRLDRIGRRASLNHGPSPAWAIIRPTLSGAKNSGAGSVFACTLTKASMASWFPYIAPMSCCISGGGGCSCANSSVNS
jgi:hypothetical protein